MTCPEHDWRTAPASLQESAPVIDGLRLRLDACARCGEVRFVIPPEAFALRPQIAIWNEASSW